MENTTNEKVLTISVAAYNVASTIGHALDSCLIPDMRLIEIIVIDDGSTDNTAKIANRYVERFPGSIRLVSKENGGYGTTVNVSLDIARGRYFKLLDGDDVFDTMALQDLVGTLSATHADLVISPFVRIYAGNGKRRIMRQVKAEVGCDLATESLPHIEELDMHALTWRTKVLRSSGMRLPAHTLYTDSLFVSMPLRCVNTVRVTDKPVYLYNLGVEGQSVSQESLRAHYEDLATCMREIAKVDATMPGGNDWASGVVRGWLVTESCLLLRVLLTLPATSQTWERITEVRRIVAEIEGLDSDCRARSKAYRLCGRLNRVTYPVVAAAYRRSGKLARG